MGFSFSGGTLIKRLCKSLLKKKLGDLILGDIDLDQLDVQLTKGVLHLSDLALNADFINQKLAGSAIMMKEASLKSLTIKLPLKQKSCEIEVEEFEIVVAPFVTSETSPDADCSTSSNDAHQENVNDTQKVGHETLYSNAGSVSPRDIDDGVKRIANAVRWFLTSFHIRIKNVYIVFDPSTILDLRRAAYNRSLVLRIKEIEFGTCLSEDALIKLNNFVKFQAAVIEFLEMGDVDALLHGETNANTNVSYPGHSTTTMLTGPVGGFSGTLNLSIPWKNGSLNLKRITADVSVDSLELRVQPSSIQWFISIWDSLQTSTTFQHNNVHKAPDPSSSICRLSPSSSMAGYTKLSADIMTKSRDGLSKSILCSSQEKVEDTLFTRTHLIQNWVPESHDAEDQADIDSDYDSSIDQFFECFEELRSSQMNSGNSGIWNWTCSVFNAITYASTLASGSDIVPTEQLTEKTLQASIEEICVVLCFRDENHFNYLNNVVDLPVGAKNYESYLSCLSSMDAEQAASTEANSVNLNIHHLEARFHNVLLDLETYPLNLKFNASVGVMKVDEYYSNGKSAAEFGFQCPSTFYNPILLSRDLRGKVLASLPDFLFPLDTFESYDEDNVDSARCSKTRNGLVKNRLLKSFDKCICQYVSRSADSDGISTTATSVSVALPPFIFWIHFHLVHMLLDLINQIELSIEKSNMRKEVAEFCERPNSSVLGDDESRKLTSTTAVSCKDTLTGKITFSTASIILCFPSKFDIDFSRPSSLDKFIILNHSPSFYSREDSRNPLLQNENFFRGYPSSPSTTIHLDLNNFDIYWVESGDTLNDGFKLDKTFSSAKILSVTGRTTDNNCGVTMIWHKGHGASPWIASRAWRLATLHEQKIASKEIGEGTGSSVTTSQDILETNSSVRRELLLSTRFVLRINFASVSIHLGKKDFKLLNDLISHVLNGLSNERTATAENMKTFESTPSNNGALQTSIIFECDMLDACITLEEVVEVSHLLQTELEGSWTCLKLRIEKFELLYASNLGGASHAGFLWVNHGEGELWGSITSAVDKSHEKDKDFLLIVCRNSAGRRGDGEGTNVLSFGTAGSSVTHMWNPKLCQSYLSIVVRCGTAIVPGGRFDWISAIGLLFSSPSQENEQPGNDVSRNRPSDNSAACKSSFFLDLEDIALSYEPHTRSPMVNDEITDLGPSCFFETDEEINKQRVACLLAASSLNLYSHAGSGSTSTDYNIQLHDLGLLICESTGSENVSCGYHVNYLHQAGYVKVAQSTLVVVVLSINHHIWKLNVLDSHINISTCHDTTYGLIRLISQLQQLYAPDMQDALVHLQSRWNRIQQVNEESISTDAFDRLEKRPSSEDDSISVGLLAEILEDAFYMNERSGPSDDYSTPSSSSPHAFKLDDGHILGVSTQRTNDTYAAGGTLGNPLEGDEEQHDSCSPQIIDTYYAPDLLSPSSLSSSSHSHNEGHARRDVGGAIGGWYANDSLMIVEDHIAKMNSQPAEKQSKKEKFGFESSGPTESCNLKGKVLLQNMGLRWRMYAGDDWSKPRKNPNCSLSSVGRDASSCLELSILGLKIEYDMYPDGEVRISKLFLSSQDINLYDNSKDAPWRMVLGCYISKDFPRESCSKAIRLELEAVRPEPLTPLEDYRLNLELLPLRLHLDQGQLNFLVSFFHNDSCNDPRLPPDLDESETSGRKSMSFRNPTTVEEALLPFFQKFDVRPLVIRVDYIPRQFDPISLSKGNYAELLNLVQWKGIDLKLKNVSAVGVYGWSNILETVAGEWLEDISHNQVPNLLKGLAPVRSLFAVSSGTSKLVSLPMKSYKKDGKLLKGMQRGAVAFIRSISIEAVGVGVHLAAGAHEILLKTECILTTIPPPPPVPSTEVNRGRGKIRLNQPEGAQQGIQQAYESLTEGLGRSASALFSTPLKAYQRGAGAGSALATALRAAPAAAIAPVSASARAVHYALLGLRNSLDPEHKRESVEKYLGPQQQ